MAIKEDRKKITLLEHDKLFCRKAEEVAIKNSLPEKEFNELKNYLLDYPTEDDKPPLLVKGDHLKATNYVGAILTEEGTQIEILPKIDLGSGSKSGGEESANEEESNKKTRDIFMHMLCTYLGKYHRQFDSGAWGKSSLPLLEEFMAVFLQDVSTVVRRGLARAYIPYEENLTCLKGKLDFSNHIRHNLFHKERFYVRYDEFSIDRPINRVLKKALRAVSKITQDQDNYRRASQLLNYFEEVRETRDWRHEVKISSMDRSVKFKAYEHSFEWAKLILRNFSPDNWQGERDTISLLFPMEKVFEFYVVSRLQDLFGRLNMGSIAQSKQYKVMEEYRENNRDGSSFTIIPDMVVKGSISVNKYCMILDTKWKELDGTNSSNKYGISQSDIYQLYSYGKVYQEQDEHGNAASLILLYPWNTNFKYHIDFFEGGAKSIDNPLSLKIVPVNLADLASDHREFREEAERQLLENILPDKLWQSIQHKLSGKKSA